MAEASFDIEAGVDRQEVDNAVNQASKEVAQRWDFKDTATVIAWAGDDGIQVESVSDDRAAAALEVLRDKCVKRKVSLKALDIGEPRQVGGGRTRVDIELMTSLSADLAKQIVKAIKTSKLKVTPTNMGDKVRVKGKSRDDLQQVQQIVKEQDYDAPLRFGNYQ